MTAGFVDTGARAGDFSASVDLGFAAGAGFGGAAGFAASTGFGGAAGFAASTGFGGAAGFTAGALRGVVA
ncbi:RNA chaperone Hfq, partial [Pyxidicoccus fallax]|uniref:hypothetical protein n=1 Tax=Pyxidicoccus fallax TaxID=394095 RepID=UPI001C12F085